MSTCTTYGRHPATSELRAALAVAAPSKEDDQRSHAWLEDTVQACLDRCAACQTRARGHALRLGGDRALVAVHAWLVVTAFTRGVAQGRVPDRLGGMFPIPGSVSGRSHVFLLDIEARPAEGHPHLAVWDPEALLECWRVAKLETRRALLEDALDGLTGYAVVVGA